MKAKLKTKQAEHKDQHINLLSSIIKSTIVLVDFIS